MANYDINYDDQRFQKVESEKQAALTEHEQTYDSMISNSDKYYQSQIDASKDYANKQTELQNQQTDFAIQEIEQQKADAQKDYTKEQSGAYVDWQKQSNQYGVNAEQTASNGMQNTGYSESSLVSMYNTYQNRVTTARESFNRAVQNYNNSITQARLQNNAALAEIAYNALQQQLELSLQGFQYKNQLLLDKASKKLEIENSYYNRYQDVLNQINTENSLAEQIRQFNESMALEREQFQWQKEQAEKSNSSSGSSSGSGSISAASARANMSNRDRAAYEATKTDTGSTTTATDYYNAMVRSGANKSQVVGDINQAVKDGAITKQEAAELKKVYNPRGEQYQ